MPIQLDRLRLAQRLTSRQTASVPTLKPMVKRVRTATVTTSPADFKATAKNVKTNGAWRYKGGLIERMPERTINGKEYYDPKDPTLNRRKHESNFFLTLNTNLNVGDSGLASSLPRAQKIMAKVLTDLAKEEVMCTYFVFGPKDTATYQDDRYEDVIKSVEWKSAVEVGPQRDRLHAHVWMTVQHYSQVQLSPHVLQVLFKRGWNSQLQNVGGDGSADPLHLWGLPYVHIKLLPQSDFSDVIKQYLHKGMMASGAAS